MACVFIVVNMNDSTFTVFGPSSNISNNRQYKMKRSLPQIPSCKCAQQYYSDYFHATPTLFTQPMGKVPIKTVLVQGLKKLRPAVFKQLLAIDIFFRLDSVHIGCGILPKGPWHRPCFFSPSRWSEVISGTESDAMLVWITTERENHEK